MALITVPGLADSHVHFRDPGQTEKEDILTGAAAAVRGGYTSVVMMGNTVPHPDNTGTLRYMIDKGAETPIRVYSAANVTVGMLGKELTDLGALAAAGAVLFTDDGLPVMDEGLMREACRRAAALDIPISLHEEDPAYVSGAGVNAGSEAALKYGVKGADRLAEITMVKRDIGIANATGAEIIIQHISAAESVELLREARRDNPLIHAEATPHHFTLTEDDVLVHGTLAKMNPPLRTAKDREAIREGLADGTIEIIATDHAPHTEAEKAREFTKAPSGITGLETALSLGIRELVGGGYLTMDGLLACMSANPMRILKLPADSGDTVTIDTGAEWTVTREFASKACNSPFIGETLPGVVRRVTCKGKVVYEHT